MGVCEVCKRKVESGEEFVLTGVYPTEGQVLSKNYRYRVPPETYGKIYHKGFYQP
jgi:hypothetical protein